MPYRLATLFSFWFLACTLPEKPNHPPSSDESIRTMLMQIQHVSSAYTDTTFLGAGKKEESTDSAFNRLVKMDTAAIEQLIAVLVDTAVTRILNPCDKNYFTVGQLATVIIDEIESIPIAAVTGVQFDVLDCGILPYGFLEYVRQHGAEFQHRYMTYYHSEKGEQDRRNYPKSVK